MNRGLRTAAIAWLTTAVYYLYRYILRAAPAVGVVLAIVLTFLLKETGSAARSASAPLAAAQREAI